VPDLLIRHLDPETHGELRRRAERAGQSLQSYVAHLLRSHVSSPTVEDWLARLDEIEPVPGASGSEAVADARAELP
jgi:plasmid stability protein